VAWVIDRRSFRAFDLPGRKELDPWVAEIERLSLRGPRVDARARAERARDRLSRMLLDPIAPALTGTTLIVVPDGDLSAIAFAALPTPGTDRFVPLVERHEIVVAPSASVWAALDERARKTRPGVGGAAVFADPIYAVSDTRLGAGLTASPRAVSTVRSPAGSLERLPASADEAEAIVRLAPPARSSLWRGGEASRAHLLAADLGSYRILHFATHGLAVATGGEEALVLSRFDGEGRAQVPYLTASDVARLDLHAQLVVLSACRTALGMEPPGEGLSALGRSFLRAGAASLLVSLWDVDDRATAELMARFYSGLLQRHLSPAAALRAAQRDMSRQVPWTDPFYWAGFVLIGDGA
jgi:CHAT domain-containing protein